HGLHAVQQFDHALVEPKISYSVPHLAALDQEGADASHAREHLLVRVHFADVPKPGHQDSPLSSSDHLVHRLFLAGSEEDDVQWYLTKFIGQGQAVPAGSDLSGLAGEFGVAHLSGGAARINNS